jgi:hypothetical protein
MTAQLCELSAKKLIHLLQKVHTKLGPILFWGLSQITSFFEGQ